MKAVNLHKAETSKAVEVAREYKTKVEYQNEIHFAKIRHLLKTLQKEEQASVGLNAALALEEGKKKKGEANIVKERKRIVEVEEQAISSFKSLKELGGH